ncbi:hypothetical protein BPAE_0009g00240 [Botrytis paeoniae]|uniref:Uncharacterized protein n=1 Tax=Botrytis paeoniae TaxID=278948 RepID=A0A4Z1G214_9HELO|nr:hypothetical protein BPAE_0009g00240 [Botrytis paeoniae]
MPTNKRKRDEGFKSGEPAVFLKVRNAYDYISAYGNMVVTPDITLRRKQRFPDKSKPSVKIM